MMKILGDMNTIVSLIAAILSIVMFFLTKKEKKECVKIKNEINQKIEIVGEKSSIDSNDQYEIDTITTFDNRKSIK